MRKRQEQPEHLGWRDYFQIITTCMMLALSGVILWQTFFLRWAIPSVIFGLALLLYSLFRVRMIRDYFRKRGGKHGI